MTNTNNIINDIKEDHDHRKIEQYYTNYQNASTENNAKEWFHLWMI
jgi:hypothetical protein